MSRADLVIVSVKLGALHSHKLSFRRYLFQVQFVLHRTDKHNSEFGTVVGSSASVGCSEWIIIWDRLFDNGPAQDILLNVQALRYFSECR